MTTLSLSNIFIPDFTQTVLDMKTFRRQSNSIANKMQELELLAIKQIEDETTAYLESIQVVELEQAEQPASVVTDDILKGILKYTTSNDI